MSKERIKHWEERIESVTGAYNRLDALCDRAIAAGVLDVEGCFHEGIWSEFELMLGMVDSNDWLAWWIYDNQCGKGKMRAGYGKPRVIKTPKQMAALIAEGESRSNDW